MLLRLLHPSKAQLSILIALSGIEIPLRFLHSLNEWMPMLVIPSGMTTLFRLWHPWNVHLSMPLTGNPSISFGIVSVAGSSPSKPIMVMPVSFSTYV